MPFTTLKPSISRAQHSLWYFSNRLRSTSHNSTVLVSRLDLESSIRCRRIISHKADSGHSLHQLEARGVCDTGNYGQLNAALVRYPPAQAFCAANFASPCAPKAKRQINRIPRAATTPQLNAQASAYSVLLKQPRTVASTVCYCIKKDQVRFGIVSRAVQLQFR